MSRAVVVVALALSTACGPRIESPDASVEHDAARADGGRAQLDAGHDASIDAGSSDDASIDAGDALPPIEEGELEPGGATTTHVLDVGAFVQRAANLSLARRAEFESGLQFFQLPWVIAPGRPEADGVGPTFNAISCLTCHARNGRGLAQSSPEDLGVGVLLRIGSASGEPDAVYGDQLQPFGIPGVPGEGTPRRFDEAHAHLLADGSSFELFAPRYEIVALAHGPLAVGTRISPRIAPALIGQGLLEAIDDADVLAWADPDDADGDGISGRARWVVRSGEDRLGRFGWKAAEPDVRWQTAAAFLGDLGITTPNFPDENCPPLQTECDAAPSGGTPELTDARLVTTAAYVRLLGVPARRDGESERVRRGKALFTASGCTSCHRPSYVTGRSVEPELASQRIWPYSDLLLHDMGERLADDRAEGDASGREWRTPPLWGLGLVPVVNGALHLLHDGRARSVAEAIFWHDGEAERSRLAFERLSEPERDALITFVESL